MELSTPHPHLFARYISHTQSPLARHTAVALFLLHAQSSQFLRILSFCSSRRPRRATCCLRVLENDVRLAAGRRRSYSCTYTAIPAYPYVRVVCSYAENSKSYRDPRQKKGPNGGRCGKLWVLTVPPFIRGPAPLSASSSLHNDHHDANYCEPPPSTLHTEIPRQHE